MKSQHVILSTIFIVLLLCLSCKKESTGPFTLTISNPFDHDILIKGHIDGCSYSEYAETLHCRIKPNGHQTYSSFENSVTKENVIHIYIERASDGEQVGSLLFNGVPGKIYDWTAGYNNEPVLFDSSKHKESSSLTGKWMNLKACKNTNGDSSYFQFNGNGTGKFFNSDCNSTCAGYGLTFHFKFSTKDKTLSLNYTKADSYCGQPVNKPASENVSFSISGKVLSINGVSYTKVE